ncbi:MAG: DUF5320 domain-containing protein [Thermoanaerobacteraceae bacterium]|nr:DUF5320 domain-containing protein [Thermoanaerobacteraceae bacterium]
MPRGDRTGPWGLGPMTGRRAGYCAGFPVPGFMNPGWWGGFRRFWGGLGRGWRHMYYATGLPGWMRGGWWAPPFPGAAPYPEEFPEVEVLKQQASLLEQQLQAIRAQIEALQQKGKQQEEKGE